MANKWIEFVRKWAKDHDTTYGCAISQPACKEEYRAKYGNRKKLTKAKEKELMGMEDFPAPATGVKKVKKVKKPPSKEAKERFAMAQEDISSKKAKEKAKEMDERYSMGAEEYLTKKYKSDLSREKAKEMEERYSMGAEEFDTKRYNRDLSKEKAKELRELSRMMGEDYNAPKLVITEKAPAKKPRGRPKKYATAEEARTARIQKTTESNKRMAEMRKKYLQEARERIRMEKEDVNRQLQRQGIVVPAPSPAPAPPSANPIPVTFFDLEEALPSEAQVKKPINLTIKKSKKNLIAELTKLQKEYPQTGYNNDYDVNEFRQKIKDLLTHYGYDFGKVFDEENLYWFWEIDNKVTDAFEDTGKRYFAPASFAKPVERRTKRLPVEFVIQKYLPLSKFTDKQIGSLLYIKDDPFSLMVGMNNSPFIRLAVLKEVIDKNYGNVDRLNIQQRERIKSS